MENSKDKAKEIYFDMLNAGKGFTSEYLALQCALIAVDSHITECSINVLSPNNRYGFWKQVKKELKKLGNLK